jgi:hypothetical protein
MITIRPALADERAEGGGWEGKGREGKKREGKGREGSILQATI